MLNVMAMCVQLHANVSKQQRYWMVLALVQFKWRVCGCGLNWIRHEGMYDISNVTVHLKTCSGNVNFYSYYPFVYSFHFGYFHPYYDNKVMGESFQEYS